VSALARRVEAESIFARARELAAVPDAGLRHMAGLAKAAAMRAADDEWELRGAREYLAQAEETLALLELRAEEFAVRPPEQARLF